MMTEWIKRWTYNNKYNIFNKNQLFFLPPRNVFQVRDWYLQWIASANQRQVMRGNTVWSQTHSRNDALKKVTHKFTKYKAFWPLEWLQTHDIYRFIVFTREHASQRRNWLLWVAIASSRNKLWDSNWRRSRTTRIYPTNAGREWTQC